MSLRSSTELGSLDLGNVQETLLTPLCARADQLGRADAIIVDEAARKIVESINYDFDKIRKFPNTLTGCAIRASIMDEWIQQFLAQHPTAAVGLLGVGLDTVFERNDRQSQVHWYEFDFEDVISIRAKCFEPDPRRRLIAGDIFDTYWIHQVKSETDGPWLFQAAGVLMYLPPNRVQELFKLLADHFPGCVFLFDGCSHFAKDNSHRWEATIKTTAATYQWAIDDPREIATWDERFHITDVRYMLDYHRHQWHWSTRFWSRLIPKLRSAYHINRAVLQG